MGKSTTWPYRLEIKCVSRKHYTPMEWRCRMSRFAPGFGMPTAANIDKWVTVFEESMRTGPNKHLGLDQVVTAQIVDQRTGDVVATWDRSSWRKNQPMFEIID